MDKRVPFLFDVARGLVPGYSTINKFGHNPAVAVGGEDIWSGGGDYDFYPTTAQEMEILSSTVNDASAGTGARTVMIYGLNQSYQEISEMVTLDGTTPVDLAKKYRRMYRVVSLTAGSIGTNDGNITVRAKTGGSIGAYVTAGHGQTQQAIFTIPLGKTAFFITAYVSVADPDKGGETAGFRWLGRVNNGSVGAWTIKGQISLNTLGSSNWQRQFGTIPAIPEKTDLRLRAFETTAVMGVVGGFDLILVDNDK